MSMRNPHNPEGAMWDAIVHWNQILKEDPHNTSAKENTAYYTDQWFKQCEKRVVSEMKANKIKETAGDKKIKPKADKLSSE